MEELLLALKSLQSANHQVEKNIASSLTCENPKVLEIIMENILL